ncbi:MAG: sodium:proton antiporter [Pedobacter sp.]|nr:MAG: sodium:proton antiporter [Pedobacter sp.]
MTTYTILIALSLLVIFSYLFDLFAKKTKLPSILLLLALGIGLRLVADQFNWQTFNFFRILPTLGTIGLILIVFEGALELKYEPSKNKVIKSAFSAAFFILLGTVLVITLIIHQITGQDWQLCFINAIPFSIISSAIAIPSVAGFSKKTREFVIYESSFSDILGIILFNFAISNTSLTIGSFTSLGFELLSISLLSIVACGLLMIIMKKITHHVKFFLILSILILVYAIGQTFHLPSLVLILVFGLFLNNADQFDYLWFKTKFWYDQFNKDLVQLHQLSAESAFIIRTFFFVIFGFTIDIGNLNDSYLHINGAFILASIFGLRFIYLKIFSKENLRPETFVSPRGLISILLFYNIPKELQIPTIDASYLFLTVLGTSVIMTIGLMLYRPVESSSTEA